MRINPPASEPLQVDITDLRLNVVGGATAFSDGSSGTAAPGTLYTLRGVDLTLSGSGGSGGCGALFMSRAPIEVLPGVAITRNVVRAMDNRAAVCVTGSATLGPAGVTLDEVDTGSANDAIRVTPATSASSGPFVLAGNGTAGSAGVVASRVLFENVASVVLRDLEVNATGEAVTVFTDEAGLHAAQLGNLSGALTVSIVADGAPGTRLDATLSDLSPQTSTRLTLRSRLQADLTVAVTQSQVACIGSGPWLDLQAHDTSSTHLSLDAVSVGACSTSNAAELWAFNTSESCFSSVDASYATGRNLVLRNAQTGTVVVQQLSSATTNAATLRSALEAAGNSFAAMDDVVINLASGSAMPGTCRRPAP